MHQYHIGSDSHKTHILTFVLLSKNKNLKSIVTTDVVISLRIPAHLTCTLYSVIEVRGDKFQVLSNADTTYKSMPPNIFYWNLFFDSLLQQPSLLYICLYDRYNYKQFKVFNVFIMSYYFLYFVIILNHTSQISIRKPSSILFHYVLLLIFF